MSGSPQLNPCLAGTKSEPTEDTNLPPNMKANEEKKVECDIHSKDPDTTLSSTFDRIYKQCDCCPDWVYTTGVSPDEDDEEKKEKMKEDEDDNHTAPYSSSDQSTDDHAVQSQPSEDHPARSQLTESQSMKNLTIKNQLIETHPTASKPVNERPAGALPIASRPIQNPLAAPEQVTPANVPSPHTAHFTSTPQAHPVENQPTGWMGMRDYWRRWLRHLGRG